MNKDIYYFVTKKEPYVYLVHEVSNTKFGNSIKMSSIKNGLSILLSDDYRMSTTFEWIGDFEGAYTDWDEIIDGKVAESYLIHLKSSCTIIGDSIDDLEAKFHQNFLDACKSILYQNREGKPHQINEGYLLWFLNTIRTECSSEDVAIAKLMLEEVGIDVEDF